MNEKENLAVYRLNDDERAAVRRGLRELREGRIASDEAVFDRYRS